MYEVLVLGELAHIEVATVRPCDEVLESFSEQHVCDKIFLGGEVFEDEETLKLVERRKAYLCLRPAEQEVHRFVHFKPLCPIRSSIDTLLQRAKVDKRTSGGISICRNLP